MIGTNVDDLIKTINNDVAKNWVRHVYGESFTDCAKKVMKRPFFDGKTIYELGDEFIVKYG